MNVLIISHIYPNLAQPSAGSFVKKQVDELSKHNQVKVVCPVPFFPPIRKFSRWYSYSQVPRRETRNNVEVFYPKYLSAPKNLLIYVAPFSFFLSILMLLRRLSRNWQIDVIHAHTIFPDGVAAVMLGKVFKKPVVVTLHGSDVLVCPNRWALVKRMIRWGLRNASGAIAVSNSLKQAAFALEKKTVETAVIHNGVDLDYFRVQDKAECQKSISPDLPVDLEQKKAILFVGHLREVKGLESFISAINQLKEIRKDFCAILVGEGDMRKKIEGLIKDLQLGDYVFLTGSRPHDEIPKWMGVCDVFCLPSRSEGFPTVLIEAIASGRPIVATSVGGIPEIISSDVGFLVSPESPEDLVASLNKALDKKWNAEHIAQHAIEYSWDKIAEKILQQYKQINEKHKQRLR